MSEGSRRRDAASGPERARRYTVRTRTQSGRSGRSRVFTLRERAACSQLCGFHLFYEGDGPRHASYETVSPSNLGRPLEAVSGAARSADSPDGHEQLRTSIVRPLATPVK